MAICRLCNKDKKLLKKSHIIPDFIYRDLKIYDDQHKIQLIDFKNIFQNLKRVIKQKTGEYERGILCNNCDNIIIGQYETYAKKAMFGGRLPENENPIATNYYDSKNNRFTKYRNINYRKFKVFLLSILWRMSISSRSLFSDLNLDNNTDNELRNMILNGNPGSISDYPIFGMTYLNDCRMPKDIIGQPKVFESDGNQIVKILIGGIFIFFHISKGFNEFDKIKDFALNSDNTWIIIQIEEGRGWEYIMNY